MSSVEKFSLSFATACVPHWQQEIIRRFESLVGRDYLQSIYQDYLDLNKGPENFWNDVVQAMKLGIIGYGNTIETIPEKGPLVVVANHPFGLVDGATAAWLVAQRRLDFKVVLWDVFEKSGSAADYLLTLDLTENSTSARKQNVRVRREASQYLSDGHAIIIFPSGSAERSKSMLGQPKELPWAAFTEKMIEKTGASVLLMHFHGHNSRLFHLAGHVSEILRQSLWFREIARRIDTDVEVTIGSPINQELLEWWAMNNEVTERLYEATMSLGHQKSRLQRYDLRTRIASIDANGCAAMNQHIKEKLIRT